MSEPRRRGQSVWPFVVLAGLLVAARAHADLDSVSLGAGVATPLGAVYEVYGRYPTFLGDVAIGHEKLGPNLKLVGTGEVGIATVNNTTTQVTRLWSYAAYLGLRYEAPQGGGLPITPYFGLQVGAIYDVLGFNGPTAVDSDAGFEFASRMATGFDFWLSPHLACDFGFPLEFLAVKDSLFIWDATFSLRWKL